MTRGRRGGGMTGRHDSRPIRRRRCVVSRRRRVIVSTRRWRGGRDVSPVWGPARCGGTRPQNGSSQILGHSISFGCGFGFIQVRIRQLPQFSRLKICRRSFRKGTRRRRNIRRVPRITGKVLPEMGFFRFCRCGWWWRQWLCFGGFVLCGG